ncbi:MAG: zinc ribbon domain-containing protein, partial [Planctomycetota bacterium]|nr:zinc ribbon domain-containing protein [Planctomycetota bacterium]
MEVALRDCPACSAVIMGNETVCPDCGAELPAVAAPPPPPVSPMVASRGGRVAAAETPCPGCGMMLPPGVLRCRDCGAFTTLEVEQAAMARMASRMYGGTGGAQVTGVPSQFGTGFSNSGFSTVADDDDFDLNPNFGFAESTITSDFSVPLMGDSTVASESDFEMPAVGGGGYDLTESSPAPETSAAPVVPVVPVVPASTVAVEEIPIAAPEPAAPAGGESRDQRATEATSDVDHSVNTAGEALLNTALEEQTESQNRAKGGRRKLRSQTMAVAPGRFLVFCPKGHRVQVQEKHRGRTGRCPNCKTMFFVPMAETSQTSGETGTSTDAAPAAAPEAPAAPAAGYTKWVTDVLLHRMVPKNLKLLPASLLADGLPVDLGISADHILVAVLFSGGGPFRSMQEPKQKAANRKTLLEHLAANKALVELKLPAQHTLSREQLQQLRIVQPSTPTEESVFADVPVFGEGRIGVRVSSLDTPNDRAYLSFTLGQFRQFSEALGETFGLADFGSGTAIPMQDEFVE